MEYKIRGSNLKKDFLKEIFENRGINQEDIMKYLHPSFNNIQDWSALDNIKDACYLLKKHIDNNSKIGIIVDVDVDGTTSAATLWNFIKRIKPELQLEAIIHEKKLHGLTDDLYENVYNNDYNLIAIPDAGSNDYDKHKKLKDLGIDVLILDHHEAPYYSENAIVVNNQLSKNYKNKSLSGAGVVWQFIRAYIDIFDLDIDANDFLDVVATGNIADMSSLKELETRTIAIKGLMNEKNMFIKHFHKVQNYSIGDKLTPIGVAFYIAPSINAVHRTGTFEEKKLIFNAMLEGVQDQLVPSTKRGCNGEEEYLYEQAIRTAMNVRNRQNKIIEGAIKYIEEKIESENLTKHKLLLIEIPKDKVPQEVVGLIANKIAPKYQQPTLLLRRIDDKLMGSGRNFSNSPIEDFRGNLEKSQYTEYATGHAAAFGTCIKAEDKEKFLEEFDNKWKDIIFKPVYMVDYDFNIQETSFNFEEIEKLSEYIYSIGKLNEEGIWGQDMPESEIIVKNLPVDNIQLLSPDKKPTLKISCEGIDFMKFKSSEEEYNKLKGNNFGTVFINLLGKPNINSWGGRTTPQILINDYEIVGNKYSF